MYNKKQPISILTKLKCNVLSNYHTFIEAKYPWLCLCNNHWKADALWTNNWTGWKPDVRVTQDEAQLGALKREHSINEDQAGSSSKQPKTTAVEKSAWPKPAKKVGNFFCGVCMTTECILNGFLVPNSHMSWSVGHTDTPFSPANLLQLTQLHTSSQWHRYIC